jgi:membrane-bound lytic murein transglycosylase F
LFEEGQNVSGIDWRLLAAISYHESHWNPLATSSTNVRGLMMLTEETADRMKVTDRLDPRQSILAGARYLRLLQEELPRRIANEERIWLGLAAYNQGQGHLEDARVLTARAKLNADTWLDVKKMMPLLTQPEYFEQTKHGYARGGEAVILVETVRLYYDMLKHLDTHEMPNLQTSPFRLKLPGASRHKLP